MRALVTFCLSVLGLLGAEHTPLIVNASVPKYPQIAIQARISGRVRVRFKVVFGIVTNPVVVQSDNKILSDSTLTNIRSWKFEAATNAQIETEFVYEIGKSEAALPQNPDVELQLPGYVRLVAHPVRPTVNY